MSGIRTVPLSSLGPQSVAELGFCWRTKSHRVRPNGGEPNFRWSNEIPRRQNGKGDHRQMVNVTLSLACNLNSSSCKLFYRSGDTTA
jgi:hypothetical protein